MREARMRAWFDATTVRRSRRAFDSTPVDAERLDALAAACGGFHPHPDARVALVAEPTVDVFSGIVGSYGKVTGAPHVLFMIADSRSPHSQQHAGYVGEAAILEATSMGLGTCWIGGFFDSAKAERLIRLDPNERVVAVSPVGTPVEKPSSAERAMSRMARSRRRKPLDRITSESTENWPAWALAALECARIAPSAVNRQPWRFNYEEPCLIVSRDSLVETPKVTKALDCGIAMLHAELGALSVGIAGAWEDLDSGRALARFRPIG